MKIKKLLLFAGLCGLAFRPAPVATGASNELLPHTLLWKISGNGLKKPSWLFGTMHVLCADEAKLSSGLKSAIEHCDQIYFEIKLDDFGNMLGALKSMRMNDDSTLSDLLSKEDYQKVKGYMTNHPTPLPFDFVEHFKPMLISSLLEEQELPCKSPDGMELEIMQVAHAQNKTIQGLETAEFQAGLFDSIPYKLQAKDLVDYIDSTEQNKKLTGELTDMYKKQDLDGIDKLSREGDPDMNNYMDILLYDRNRKWAVMLDSILPEKSTLVAVGAAHLPGQDGLIDLLKKRGYTLTPILSPDR